jgi:hypothetical protein
MVSALAPALADSWPAILETGQRLAHGEKVREEVLCVQAFRSSDTPDRPLELHVCGATEKVLDNLAAHRPLTRATIGNASRAAMTLVSRAMHFGIELPEDLAAGPPTYHPYGTQTVEQTGGEEA